MPKRFIDTEIWQSDSFIDATPEQKLLTIYLYTNCNMIGVFKKSLKLVSFELGFSVDEVSILSCPVDIELVGNNKYWLDGFCHFQYGELKETCKPHKRYIEELKKEGLFKRVCKGYAKGINTLEEKEEEQYKEIEEDKELEKAKETKKKPKVVKHKYGEYKNVLLSDAEMETLKTEFSSDWEHRIEKLSGWIESKGAKYKSHLATIRNWAKNDTVNSPQEKARRKEYKEPPKDYSSILIDTGV